MVSARKAAFVSGVSIGALLVFVEPLSTRVLGALLVGAFFVWLWQPSTEKERRGENVARLGIIAGLVFGVARQFLLLILIIVGAMEPTSHEELYAFEQEWGYNYYTFNILFDVFGGAALAAVSAFFAVGFVDPNDAD